MDSGCLCCTIRSDLSETLRELFLKRLKGDVPPYERVVIETTGLADPAPILHTLMTDPLIAARFRLDGVVTTVDAVHGSGQLDDNEESLKQAAVADRLVLTKTDIAPKDQVASLKGRLAALNPAALQIDAQTDGQGEAALPVLLFDAGLYNPATKSLDVQRWLKAEAYEDHGDCDHDHGECHHDHGDHHAKHEHGHHHDANRHDDAIGAFCLTLDKPLVWDQAVGFFETLARLRGPDILRVKGLLNVEGSPRPIVIHGVQHLFHPPVQLDAWPSDDRRSRIVFITRDIGRTEIETLFRACTSGEKTA
jgi:G3E family GTPase